MTVARLRQEMSNQEFTHWIAYYAEKHQREEIAAKRRKRR